MKKFVLLILGFILCLCLVACSGDRPSSEEKKETPEEPTASPEEVVDALKDVVEDVILEDSPMRYIDESRYYTDINNYEELVTTMVMVLFDITDSHKRENPDYKADLKYKVTMTDEGVVILKDGKEAGPEDELVAGLKDALGSEFGSSFKKKVKDLPDYVIETDCSGENIPDWVIRSVDPKSFREDRDAEAKAGAGNAGVAEADDGAEAAVIAAEPEDIKETGEGENTDMTDKNEFAAGISADDADRKEETEDSGVSVNENIEIEVECPASATAKREGTEYSDFVHFTYYSETCGMERGANVLLPVGYSEEKKYPVLYMLHGIFGDENSFKGDVNMKTVWANMAADGITEEMIVVFPNMYAKTEPDQAPAFTAEACLPYDNFVNDLVNDLMPYMEANYSILTGRENTAVAGFSMGGRETLYISLLHPELFAYACAISPAPGLVPGADMFMSHPGSMTEEEVRYADGVIQPEILILCGTKDSVVGTFPKEYHELMEKNGIAHTWYEVPGADHDNRAIMSGVYNFLCRVFK